MPTCRRILRAAVLIVASFAVSLATAGAQTTLVLNAPGTQVTDTMVQAGSFANSNFGKSDMLATRASVNVEYLRRALLKFDTQNTLPANSQVRSAVLTLTVKMGGTEANRAISVFPVTSSFVQEEATWNVRRISTPWTASGGDLGVQATTKAVSNVAGAKVNIDLTALVQAAVNGSSSSRYTRLALADLGASTSASYREYFSSEAADPSVRPALIVVYGGTVPIEPPAPWTGVTLRVLQYNTHHGGYGTDDVYSTERIADWVVKTNPDVVSLQEIEVNDSWSKGTDQGDIYQDLLQRKTGTTWYKVWFHRSGGTTGLGQLILSKYPFVATAHVLLSASRSAVDATITVNGRTITFTSAHLDNALQSNRIKQIAELLFWETTLAENRIVVGDYNAWPNTTEIANMTKTYVDTWAAAKAAGTAIAWSANPDGITHGSHRIDYIFQSKGATGLKLQSVQVFDTSDHSGTKCIVSGTATCFANSTGIDPSDHRPVMAVFEVR
jgi:endonuclease/exonuclease/phosphatase family metal-dependent hydrolase